MAKSLSAPPPPASAPALTGLDPIRYPAGEPMSTSPPARLPFVRSAAATPRLLLLISPAVPSSQPTYPHPRPIPCPGESYKYGAPPPRPGVPRFRFSARHGGLPQPQAASAPALTTHSEAIRRQRRLRLQARHCGKEQPVFRPDDGVIQHRNSGPGRLRLGDSWISIGPDRLYVYNEMFVRWGVHQG